MSNHATIVTALLAIVAYFFTSGNIFVYYCAVMLVVLALASTFVQSRVDGQARRAIIFVFILSGIVFMLAGFIHIQGESIKNSASERVLVTIGDIVAEKGQKASINDANIFLNMLGVDVSRAERELYFVEVRKTESISAYSREVLRGMISQLFEGFVSASWWITVIFTFVIGGTLFIVWLMSSVRHKE